MAYPILIIRIDNSQFSIANSEVFRIYRYSESNAITLYRRRLYFLIIERQLLKRSKIFTFNHHHRITTRFCNGIPVCIGNSCNFNLLAGNDTV